MVSENDRRKKDTEREPDLDLLPVTWVSSYLPIRQITEMSEDGYLFEIDDGRIQKILMLTGTSK